MKRNNLTTALLAGLAGAAGLASTAQAVNLNPDGLGQVLIYPYYTINKNNNTLISVVNTTSDVKAVKVRFLEGKNSAEVLDFNLYLSPFDVWTGAVIETVGGGLGASLITADKSCTVPIIGNAVIPFRNNVYVGDKGGNGLNRTREGYLEMIEMGVVIQPSSEATAATHVNGVPRNCQVLVNAWLPGGDWSNSNGANNVTSPAGGLYGSGTIVDVGNGTLHAYTADAIEGFYTSSPAAALHSNPGDTFPSLAEAETSAGLADTFVFTATGTLVASTFDSGTDDAVSALYMHDSIYNEFVTSPALGATSEWVVTFPTKRFYTQGSANPAVAPFTNVFPDNGSACEPIGIAYWDREEQVPGTPPGSIDFSPLPEVDTPAGPALCYEAQIVTFNQEAAVTAGASLIFGSTYASNINTVIGVPPNSTTANTGHARIDFDTDPGHVLTDNAGTQYFGLPVTGFWSVNYVNSAAQAGKLANYSGAYRHRASRNIVAAAPPAR